MDYGRLVGLGWIGPATNFLAQFENQSISFFVFGFFWAIFSQNSQICEVGGPTTLVFLAIFWLFILNLLICILLFIYLILLRGFMPSCPL
jgi:hypothetical protein